MIFIKMMERKIKTNILPDTFSQNIVWFDKFFYPHAFLSTGVYKHA